MKIAFFTNFINHHQVPLADEFYKILNDNYKMVTFEPIPEEFLRRGYKDYSDRPYLIEAFKDNTQIEYAKDIIKKFDVVIWGDAPEELIHERIESNLLTFRYTERFFKRFDRRFLQKDFWKTLYYNHTVYRKNNCYVLAANAYQRFDTSVIFSYPGKVYKWGYFIKSKDLKYDEIEKVQNDNFITMLWCATFSECKHPEIVIHLAHKMKSDGINFVIDMYGSDGGLKGDIIELIKKLDLKDCVRLCGSVSNEEMLYVMEKHQIYLFTSDYGEGWGAVLSEAMGAGCVVIASDSAGATKFLVNKENGIIYRCGSFKNLYDSVKSVINDIDKRKRLAVNAYDTMHNVWSPQNAAKNFILLVDNLMYHKKDIIKYGPCSKARFIIPNFIDIVVPIIKRKFSIK